MRDDLSQFEAGNLDVWIGEIRGAMRGEHDAEVPCGTCHACCTASQFIHVAPDETATLARIPKQLLFPAPGLPRGHQLMGYDEHGHCPMFIDDACSIYEDRPQTCRAYDCRIFAATGVEVDEPVASQVARWRFDDEANLIAALHAAAKHVAERPDAPRNPVDHAAAAIEHHSTQL